VAGILSVDVIEACQEQAGLAEFDDEAGASQAVQMLRAIKHKNVAAVCQHKVNLYLNRFRSEKWRLVTTKPVERT
jgi:DNA-binding LacI/PurR family transcriptional regulator